MELNKVTPELANIYGHLISDGSIFPYIGYFNKEEKLINEFIINYKKVTGHKIKVHCSKNIYHCHHSASKKLVKYFDNFNVLQIKNGNNLIKCSFLRACFDDEGSISKDGIISISQKNENYINFIESLLKSVGILRIIKYEIFNKNYKKVYYYLRICKYYNKIFLKNIGFLHPKKLDRLKNNLRYTGNIRTPRNTNQTSVFEVGGSKVIRIPMSILNDSQYPFGDDDDLIIVIEGTNLIIKKLRGEKNGSK